MCIRFNKWGGCPSEINLKMQRKRCVLSLVFGDISAFLLNFELFSLGIFLLVWHLWQQKINIAVGRRACTRVREVNLNGVVERYGTEKVVFRNISFSCWHLVFEIVFYAWFVICNMQIGRWWKIFCHFFLDFSLFGAISPPIYLGTQSSCALPNFNSTFTAKANPIY